MTYVYADSTAVLGPLALSASPGAYDLCTVHAARTSVPQGWEVIRLPLTQETQPTSTFHSDDLLALADAVREAGFSYEPAPEPTGPLASVTDLGTVRRLRGLPEA